MRNLSKPKRLEHFQTSPHSVDTLISFPLSAREEINLFNYIVNHIGDELMLIDHSGRIVYINDAAARGLGYSREYILKRNVTDFFRKRISPRRWQLEHFAELKRLKGPVSIQIERRVKGGKTQVIDVTAVYMPFKKEEYILSVARDITENLAGLNRKQQEMEAEKAKTVEHFISGSVQEIQHPLMGIMTRSKNLLEKYRKKNFEYISFKEFEQLMRELDSICSEIKHCYDTMGRLIHINRKKLGLSNGSCDVNKNIREAINARHSLFVSQDIICKMELRAHLPLAGVGELEFTEIFSNILNNAFQAMPGGGNLTVKTSFFQRESQVLVEIKDTGIGIAPENIEHVFEPFFSTKQHGYENKSGLGLSVVQSLVKACRGDIVIQSRLKKGTAVKIYFPVRNNHVSKNSRR